MLHVSTPKCQYQAGISKKRKTVKCLRHCRVRDPFLTTISLSQKWQFKISDSLQKPSLSTYPCPIMNSNIVFIIEDWKSSWLLNSWRSRDSAASIATGYGSDGPGIESRWEARFSAPVQIGPGTHSASCTMGTGSFPGPERGVDHPPPFSGEVKERVQLYLYSPHGPSWPVLGWPLPLPSL
jgi:hypothetical protein